MSLEKVRPPVGRRKRNAVSTSSSFDNTSDDGSRLGNEIKIMFFLFIYFSLCKIRFHHFYLIGSYVPGQEDFDPKSRQFSPEELRPQPMSKKSKKQVMSFLRQDYLSASSL